MPGPEFIVPQERIEDFSYQIEVFGERAEHLKPVLDDILDKILARNRRGFETGGASTGVYWAPLKQSTIREKVELGVPFPFSPLRRFGPLEESLSMRGADQQEYNVDDSGLSLRSTVPYAEHHASGTSRMPRRPPMVVAAKHAREYTKDLNDFIFGDNNG